MSRFNQEKHVPPILTRSLEELRALGSHAFLKKESKEVKKTRKKGELDRLLIELFHYSLWKEDKKIILRLLGKEGDQRALEFFINFIEESDNIPLVCEAILSLGDMRTPMSSQYLFNYLGDKKSLFQKELLIALGEDLFFSFEKKLLEILKAKEASSSLKILSLLSCGHNLGSAGLPFLFDSMKESYTKNPALFNAGLLAVGRLGTKKDIDQILSFDTSFRFFAGELKEYATHRIYSRESLSLGSIFKSLGEEHYLSQNFKNKLQILRSFSQEEVFSFLENSSPQIDLNKEALVRICLSKGSLHKKDQDFFEKNSTKLTNEVICYYIRLCDSYSKQEAIFSLLKSLDFSALVTIFSNISFSKIFPFLIKLFHDKKRTEKDRRDLINALVYQSLSKSFSKKEKDSLATLLFEVFKKEKNKETKGRALRALSQIKKTPHKELPLCQKYFKNKDIDLGSFVYFLRSSSNPEATKILLKLLANSLKTNSSQEIYLLLDAIAQSKNSSPVSLPSFSREQKESCRIPLLKVLAHQKTEDFDTFIEESLKDSSPDITLLALKAFQKNPSLQAWPLIQILSLSNVEPVHFWGLDTLCQYGGFREHQFVFKNFLTKESSEATQLYTLQHIRPQGNKNYQELLKQLNEAIIKKQGPFEQENIFSAAMSLQERFLAALSDRKQAIFTKEEAHALDGKIMEKIPEYSHFSSGIKSVLRNAELTWERKDLFDALVDKSTMIIEYTKSLELMIQEKIGHVLFQESNQFVKAFQERLFFLKLHEPYLPTRRLLDNLKCFHYFPERNFPRAKFNTLVKSILSGSLAYDQYRVLDGLRAWSLIFLIFCRDFESNGYSLKSLIKLSDTSDKKIGQLSGALNDLQEVRNIAAHRGTLFNLEKISPIREKSFQILKDLHFL